MNRNENTLQEQEAPVKNGDNAFVQVGTDGHPQMPGGESEADEQSEDRLVPQQEPAK